MPQKRLTLYDIATRAGVSKTTVSLALRGNSRISEHRRKQIQKIATDLSYEPDPLLSALAVYRAQMRPATIQNAIAWINCWEEPQRLRGDHREFDAYWRGSEAAARRYGYRLEEICWNHKHPPKKIEKVLLTRGIRGILIPPHPTRPDWGDFDWDKFSVVRFGLSVPEPHSHLVTSDHQQAGIMALKRISSYGYRRIGMVVPEHLDKNIGGSYTAGFYAAQKLFRLREVKSLLLTRAADAAHTEQKRREFSKWMKAEKPDAILTADPSVPCFVHELGYAIPNDVAIAGTGLDVSADAGIDQCSEAIGRQGIEMLVNRINLNERGTPASPSRVLVRSRWCDGAMLPRLQR